MTTVVIMQPTYLPWMGYFDLIDQCDVFVFLDTVQLEKQSWQTRNRIKTPPGPAWLTVPVFQGLGQKIIDVSIRDTTNFRHKHWMSLLSNYGRAPAWKEFASFLKDSYERKWEKLVDLNIHFVTAMAAAMNLTTRFVRASELPEPSGHKADMLVDMCRHLGGDTYLSPIGARDYLTDDSAFRARGMRLVFQHFEHPSYTQRFGDFLPYMSAVDLLCNVGAQQASEILRSGRRPSLALTELLARAGVTP